MKTSLRALATFGVALALLLVAAPAGANHGAKMYIKQNGKIAFAVDSAGTLYTSGYHWAANTDPGGLQFKRNGVTQVSIGPSDAADPERFGTLNMANFEFVSEFQNLPLGQAGELRFNNNGGTQFEFLTDGAPITRNESAQAFRYRKNYANLTNIERERFRDVINALDQTFYPGAFGQGYGLPPPADPNQDLPYSYGRTSVWDKATQLHMLDFYIIHSGQGFDYNFLPWHRGFLLWMEEQMRSIDPLVTLPYWNWETNPVTDFPILSDDLNGHTGTLGEARASAANPTGRVGFPFDSLDSNFQTDPNGYFEDTGVCDVNLFNGADPSCNPAKPPEILDRHVKADQSPLDFGLAPDSAVYAETTYEAMSPILEGNAHGMAHAYLCDQGEVSRSRSPMDPMFWLLHTNCDRIWAQWQSFDPATRINTPTTVYGSYDDAANSLLNNTGPQAGKIEPFATGKMTEIVTSPNPVAGPPLRPFFFDGAQYKKSMSYKGPEIRVPALYQ